MGPMVMIICLWPFIILVGRSSIHYFYTGYMIHNNIVCYYGVPQGLISDHRSHFKDDFMAQDTTLAAHY